MAQAERTEDDSTAGLDTVTGEPAAPCVKHNKRVLLVPSFAGSPTSTEPLSNHLRSAGYDVHAIDLRRNIRSSEWAVTRIIEALHAHGPSHLVGYSRGGQQARVAAHRLPSRVRSLVTIAAPIRTHLPRHPTLRALVHALRLAGRVSLIEGLTPGDDAQYERDLHSPMPPAVDWTAIWSRDDRLVREHDCLDPVAVMIETTGGHPLVPPGFKSQGAYSEKPQASRHAGEAWGFVVPGRSDSVVTP